MAVNQHFNQRGNQNEISLRESLIIESIKWNGVDVLYVPRKWVAVDTALKEVTASSFEKAYEIEVRIRGLNELLRSAYVLSQISFGGLSTASVKIEISKRRFNEEIPDEVLSSPGRPCEGDLIFVPHAKVLLEIKTADPEDPMRSGGEIHRYILSCELFKGTHDEIPSDAIDGIADVDQVPQILLDGYVERDQESVEGVEIVSPGDPARRPNLSEEEGSLEDRR